MDALLTTVPLMDTLILTRGNPRLGQDVRQVFAGLIIDVGSDGHALTLLAQDGPDQKRLYDRAFMAAPQDLAAPPGVWVRAAAPSQQSEQ